MHVSLDLAVLELACSRLCHDLVGPVGAATNGLELLREVSANQNEEILDMTDESARTAWRRLEFFRVAFGYGGGRSGWSQSELRSLAAGMLKDTRVTLNWPDRGDATLVEGRGGKLILNLVILIAEAMPRGGEVAVEVKSGGSGLQVAVEGQGPGAAMNDRVYAAVRGAAPLAELDSRVILAHLASLQAVSADALIHWTFQDSRVSAKLFLPQPAAAAPGDAGSISSAPGGA